jgi:hypothetical protein
MANPGDIDLLPLAIEDLQGFVKSLMRDSQVLQLLHPSSKTAQQVAATAELVHSGGKAIIQELLMRLQAKQQEAAVQRWRYSCMLSGLSTVPACMLQQLDDMQQDSVQYLVDALQKRQLHCICLPILRMCQNRAAVVEAIDQVTQFLNTHQAPQWYEGDARNAWNAALQLLCQLQQLEMIGQPEACLQLSGKLLLAKTPADLSSQLEPVREQLQELLDAHCKAAAEAQAAAAAAAAAPAPAAESFFGRHPDIAAPAAAAGVEPAAGPLATIEEVLAELPSDAPAAEPCPAATKAVSCSAADASCLQLSCSSSSSSMPVMHCDSTAAATVDASAGSSSSSTALPLIMAGHVVATAVLQLPSASCGAGSCSIADIPAADGSATEPAAAAAVDGMAAGLELLSCSKPEAACPVTIMVYAGGQFDEECEASSTSSSLPEQYDTAAAAANSSALIELSTISSSCSSGSALPQQQGVEAPSCWLVDESFEFGCDFAASSHRSSSDSAFTGLNHNASNSTTAGDRNSSKQSSSSSSSASVSRKHSLLQLVPDDGPSTPAAVSVAASYNSSARASYAEYSDERSSFSSSNFSSSSSNGVGLLLKERDGAMAAAGSTPGFGLPEGPFAVGCGSGASSSSKDEDAGRLNNCNKQQRRQQRGRGGMLRRVAGCVVCALAAVWYHTASGR